jgi:hypothetical protein
LTWFYQRYTVRPTAIDKATVDEYLRTFSRRDGVLGAMGVYRSAFATTAQTEPLTQNEITTPVVAMGRLGQFRALDAKDAECGRDDRVHHRASTSRPHDARDTQIIMVFCAARSSDDNTESRCSIDPRNTAVSQVPHVPSPQADNTSMPAS